MVLYERDQWLGRARTPITRCKGPERCRTASLSTSHTSQAAYHDHDAHQILHAVRERQGAQEWLSGPKRRLHGRRQCGGHLEVCPHDRHDTSVKHQPTLST